jgi:4-alpha-glucanotransferase
VQRLAPEQRRALDALCRLYGVERSYHSALTGAVVRPSDESVLAVLAALGAPISGAGELRSALRERRLQLARRVLEPVAVAWDGAATTVTLRLPAAVAGAGADGGPRVAVEVALEDGTRRELPARLATPRTGGLERVENESFALRRLRLPADLPSGYHRLEVEVAGGRHAAHLICAPTRPAPAVSSPADASGARVWGAFLPLYALHSGRSWGAGDLTDLAALRQWLAGRGAQLVATLPLLAAFLDEPCQPSPYMPASRRFWNEFYLDPTALPEFEGCAPARALVASPEMQRELEALRGGRLVDWKRAAAARRRVLALLAEECFARGGEPRAALEAHVAAHPLLERYARFRAAAERLRQPWMRWPAAQRDGTLPAVAGDEAAIRYHLYAQWRTGQALQRLAADGGPGLYLDLPLGTHSDGFDTWSEQAAFAAGVSGGAPPDAFFTQGQDWGFPPLHPERVREQGHRYFAECVRHQMAVARALRIDHVMGLHRLYWVPHGAPPTDGTYVGMPVDELYAVLSLESARSGALVVGEDLGTVPPGVRPAMGKHGLLRTHVIECELSPAEGAALPDVQDRSLATLNTHDLPTVTAFLRGADISDRVELGLLDTKALAAERRRRERQVDALVEALRRGGWLERPRSRSGVAPRPAADELLQALLAWLGAGPARLAIVNLEDLWAEPLPQNTPGTTTERDNWKRRARLALEDLMADEQVLEGLSALAAGRRARKRSPRRLDTASSRRRSPTSGTT